MNVKAVYQLLLTKKRIYRYMLLLNIRSITARKPKRYGRVKHHSIPNLLKRDFTSTGPNQKWSIDVTYILTTEGVEYLCAVKDLHDKSIIAYSQSRFNDNRLVLTTVEAAIASVPAEQRPNLILHSDQGVQFTSKEYSQLLNTHHIHHSVSFKGSCVDNVPIESWFSLLKCECLYMVKNLTRVLSRRLVS
ncbi:MAG: transposase, partial [Tenericutes bacterium HGW-Tenericutes-6]